MKVGDRRCAELEVDIDISELEVPPEMEGEYACSTKGDSLLYFDTDKRCFVSGAMALVIQFSIDAPTPQFNMGGENAPEKNERMKMSMRADSLIEVSLKE